MRDAIERDYRDSWMYPVLLTSLIEAADRVDSTTGVQMAYVKQWAARVGRPSSYGCPTSSAVPVTPCSATQASWCAGSGPSTSRTSIRRTTSTATSRTTTSGKRWSRGTLPEHYGVACKRVDAREDHTKSVFNDRRRMPDALAQVIAGVDASLVIVSYNDEAWVSIEELEAMCRARGGEVRTLAFDSKRYVGAQIGIHNPQGEKVGQVARLRNVEYLVVCGEPELVERATGAKECRSRALSQS